MAAITIKNDSAPWVLKPNVDSAKTTQIVTDEKGITREITTYTAAPKQPVENSADYAAYLKPAGLAFLALGLVGLVYSRLKNMNTLEDKALKRQILRFSVGSILLGLAMVIFSRSVPLPSK